MEQTLKLAIGSLLVGCAVLGLKTLAYLMTGSIALYSDALESIINVAAALAALIAVRLSAKPADANHPYGHHKAEYFSAVLEGVLIVVAALAIFREAYLGYLAPKPLDVSAEGLLVNGLASTINAVWAFVLIHRGRFLRSPALVADGRHLLTDVLSSIGVLLGLGVATLTGWAVLDPVLGGLVAINILWSGWSLVTDSIGGLMDAAAPPEELEKIRLIISRSAEGAIEAHDVRTRHAGKVTFIDFHLVVDGEKTVTEAHEICDRVEAALKAAIGPAVISIHVEPDTKAKHSGVLVI
ncbi:cation diffusion facilitator family transporter [Chthonobacter albigriseus]|uniref:cation diffusion facilitator family transporter n=1 Tax=Chthonobacter albigriseus TaxID=1683161 RepID=UPI0015EECBFB|nr:cation diffusion facilitator family transporter [Chthonobacter albigriseus]